MCWDGTLDLLCRISDVEVTDQQLERWIENNKYFTEYGCPAVEMARNSEKGLTYEEFKEAWWTTLRQHTFDINGCQEVSRLGYLAYSSKFYSGAPLPESIRSMRPREACGFPFCDATESLHEDHIWPKVFGGPDAEWNRQGLCADHNRLKGSFIALNFCDPKPLRQALEAAFS